MSIAHYSNELIWQRTRDFIMSLQDLLKTLTQNELTTEISLAHQDFQNSSKREINASIEKLSKNITTKKILKKINLYFENPTSDEIAYLETLFEFLYDVDFESDSKNPAIQHLVSLYNTRNRLIKLYPVNTAHEDLFAETIKHYFEDPLHQEQKTKSAFYFIPPESQTKTDVLTLKQCIESLSEVWNARLLDHLQENAFFFERIGFPYNEFIFNIQTIKNKKLIFEKLKDHFLTCRYFPFSKLTLIINSSDLTLLNELIDSLFKTDLNGVEIQLEARAENKEIENFINRIFERKERLTLSTNIIIPNVELSARSQDKLDQINNKINLNRIEFNEHPEKKQALKFQEFSSTPLQDSTQKHEEEEETIIEAENYAISEQLEQEEEQEEAQEEETSADLDYIKSRGLLNKETFVKNMVAFYETTFSDEPTTSSMQTNLVLAKIWDDTFDDPEFNLPQQIRCLTRDAAREIIKYHKLFCFGLNLRNLPEGFELVQDSDGQYILHFDRYNILSTHNSNPYTISLKNQLSLPFSILGDARCFVPNMASENAKQYLNSFRSRSNEQKQKAFLQLLQSIDTIETKEILKSYHAFFPEENYCNTLIALLYQHGPGGLFRLFELIKKIENKAQRQLFIKTFLPYETRTLDIAKPIVLQKLEKLITEPEKFYFFIFITSEHYKFSRYTPIDDLLACYECYIQEIEQYHPQDAQYSPFYQTLRSWPQKIWPNLQTGLERRINAIHHFYKHDPHQCDDLGRISLNITGDYYAHIEEDYAYTCPEMALDTIVKQNEKTVAMDIHLENIQELMRAIQEYEFLNFTIKRPGEKETTLTSAQLMKIYFSRFCGKNKVPKHLHEQLLEKTEKLIKKDEDKIYVYFMLAFIISVPRFRNEYEEKNEINDFFSVLESLQKEKVGLLALLEEIASLCIQKSHKLNFNNLRSIIYCLAGFSNTDSLENIKHHLFEFIENYDDAFLSLINQINRTFLAIKDINDEKLTTYQIKFLDFISIIKLIHESKLNQETKKNLIHYVRSLSFLSKDIRLEITQIQEIIKTLLNTLLLFDARSQNYISALLISFNYYPPETHLKLSEFIEKLKEPNTSEKKIILLFLEQSQASPALNRKNLEDLLTQHHGLQAKLVILFRESVINSTLDADLDICPYLECENINKSLEAFNAYLKKKINAGIGTSFIIKVAKKWIIEAFETTEKNYIETSTKLMKDRKTFPQEQIERLKKLINQTPSDFEIKENIDEIDKNIICSLLRYKNRMRLLSSFTDLNPIQFGKLLSLLEQSTLLKNPAYSKLINNITKHFVAKKENFEKRLSLLEKLIHQEKSLEKLDTHEKKLFFRKFMKKVNTDITRFTLNEDQLIQWFQINTDLIAKNTSNSDFFHIDIDTILEIQSHGNIKDKLVSLLIETFKINPNFIDATFIQNIKTLLDAFSLFENKNLKKYFFSNAEKNPRDFRSLLDALTNTQGLGCQASSSTHASPSKKQIDHDRLCKILPLLSQAISRPTQNPIDFTSFITQILALSEKDIKKLTDTYQRKPSPSLEKLFSLLKERDCTSEKINTFISEFETEPFGNRENDRFFSTNQTCRIINEINNLAYKKALSNFEKKTLANYFLYVNQLGYLFPLKFKTQKNELLSKPIKDLLGNEIQDWITEHRSLINDPKCDSQKKLQYQLEFLAIAREVLYRCIGEYPNEMQIITIINSLLAKKNNLSEIPTGEGKSNIAALMASLLWFQGNSVDIGTSSNKLAERDTEQFKDFFHYLSINTVKQITKDSKIEDYAKEGVYYAGLATLVNVRSKFEIDGADFSNRKQSLVCDEADMPLLDQYQTDLRYSPVAHKWSENANPYAWIYPKLIDFVDDHHQTHNIKQAFMYLKKSIMADRLNKTINAEEEFRRMKLLSLISREKMEIWIESAIESKALFENKNHYRVTTITKKINSKDVDFYVAEIIDKHTGYVNPNAKWEEGLHQFLHARLKRSPAYQNHTIPLFPESPSLTNVSNKVFIDSYNRLGGEIWGITGTIGSKKECKELLTKYNFRLSRIPPQLPSRRKDILIKVNNAFEKNKEILKLLLSKFKKKNTQPVLFITKGTQESIALFDFLKTHLPPSSYSKLQCYNAEGLRENDTPLAANVDEQKIISNAGLENTLTISTAMFGRGVHITPQINSTTPHPEGLMTIQTFKAPARLTRQNSGRSGRQGQKGLSYIFYCEEEKLENEHRIAYERARYEFPPELIKRFYDQFLLLLKKISQEEKTHLFNVNKKEFLGAWTECLSSIKRMQKKLSTVKDLAIYKENLCTEAILCWEKFCNSMLSEDARNQLPSIKIKKDDLLHDIETRHYEPEHILPAQKSKSFSLAQTNPSKIYCEFYPDEDKIIKENAFLIEVNKLFQESKSHWRLTWQLENAGLKNINKITIENCQDTLERMLNCLLDLKLKKVSYQDTVNTLYLKLLKWIRWSKNENLKSSILGQHTGHLKTSTGKYLETYLHSFFISRDRKENATRLQEKIKKLNTIDELPGFLSDANLQSKEEDTTANQHQFFKRNFFGSRYQTLLSTLRENVINTISSDDTLPEKKFAKIKDIKLLPENERHQRLLIALSEARNDFNIFKKRHDTLSVFKKEICYQRYPLLSKLKMHLGEDYHAFLFNFARHLQTQFGKKSCISFSDSEENEDFQTHIQSGTEHFNFQISYDKNAPHFHIIPFLKTNVSYCAAPKA